MNRFGNLGKGVRVQSLLLSRANTRRSGHIKTIRNEILHRKSSTEDQTEKKESDRNVKKKKRCVVSLRLEGARIPKD